MYWRRINMTFYKRHVPRSANGYSTVVLVYDKIDNVLITDNPVKH